MEKNIVWPAVYIVLTFTLFACGAGNTSPGASSSSKAITAYSFSNPSAIGNINENDKTISITVPYGTDIAGLIATLTSTGASVKVDGTVQVSGVTVNDFTNPVMYTVTAVDGSTTLYTVTVTVALNSSKSLMSFTILGISGTINEFAKTITLSVPHGTDIIRLVASFTTTGESVKVEGTVQVSGVTANDFTNPVMYTVTAADRSTTHYTVTVKARPLPECTWVQRYSKTTSGVDWDQPTAIAVDTAGNVYVTGGGTDVTAGQAYGYATIKYDSRGNQLWLHRYDAWDWAKSIALDSSGNVYITGQPATIKYNSTGTPVWIKSYGYNDVRGISVKIDNSDSIYVTGWKMNSENKNDAVTIKYDSDGKVLWERTHHESGRYLLFKSLVIDSWGNVYAAGLSDAADGTDYKYIVVKYGSAGEELWTRHFDGVTAFATSEKISLAVDLEGAVYLGGGIVEPDLDVYSSDFGLIKYDKNGNQLWMSRYDGPGNYIDYASDIVLDSQGNIIVTGYSWGTNTDWDYTTMKYDTSGNQLWVRRFDSGRDSAKAITIDQMDSVYVTGGIWGPLGFATIKYDTDGNQSWIAYYGGPADLEGWATAIVLDISGNVYVTGYSKGASTNYDFATIKYTQ